MGSRQTIFRVFVAVFFSAALVAHAETSERTKPEVAPATPAAPAVVTTPETEGPEPEPLKSYGKQGTLIPGVQIGPKLTILGLPVPFRVGLESKWKNLVGVGFDYGFFPSLTFDNVSVKMNGWSFATRLYPWREAFYLGVALGKQTVTGSRTETILTVPTKLTLDYATTYLAPQIGWRWTGDSGFFVGVELGVQIPLKNVIDVSTDNTAASATAQFAELQADVQDAADSFGSRVWPQFALIQIGLFL